MGVAKTKHWTHLRLVLYLWMHPKVSDGGSGGSGRGSGGKNGVRS